MKFPKIDKISLKNVLILEFILWFSVLLGIFLRYINLDWGSPYFFHPDERNIIYSVSKLDLTTSLNPDFFAYGSLQIYIIYFVSLIYEFIKTGIINETIFKIPFETAVLTARNLSFFYSIVSILIGYLIAKKLNFSKEQKNILVLFLAFNTGLIQYAHFGTFESLLTLLCLLYCYFLLEFFQKKMRRYYIFSVVTFGLLISTKVSTAVFGVLLFLPLLYIAFKFKKQRIPHNHYISFLKFGYYGFISIITIASIYALTNPFSILSFNNFRSSITYESRVALGSLDVFYTGGFKETTPILYQFTRVYPFLINPLTTFLLVISIIYISMTFLRIKFKLSLTILIPLSFLFLIFFSQAFMYVKWSRYYIPTIPFIYFVVLAVSQKMNKKMRNYFLAFVYLSLVVTTIQSLTFVVNTYLTKDTRVAADEWAVLNIPKDSPVISEIYDLGIVPFNDNQLKILLFDFYSLENNPQLNRDLSYQINNSEYLILPSTRIQRSRTNHPEIFPNGNAFYSNLTDIKKYSLLYQTPCNTLCKIAYYGNGMNYFEETAYVFDRPTISIYKINHDK